MKKWIVTILWIVCASALVFSACSADSRETAAASAAPAAAYGDTAAEIEEEIAEAQDAGEAGGFQAYEGGETGLAAEAGFSAGTANIPDTNRKLVYSATFDIETAKYEQDYNAILQKLKEANGYVEYESTQGTPPERTDYYGRISTLTVRVPADMFEMFFTSVSDVGRMVSQSRNTDDISSSYFDTEARIKLLEDRRDRLMGYIEAATDPEDIIVYEQELSDVLYELDQYQGQKRQMDDLVDYTTVEITLQEIVVAADIPVDEDGLPIDQRAGNAFTKSMAGVGRFLEDFAVGFAAAAPVLILLAIIAVAVIVVMKAVRFLRKKYGKPKEEKQAEMNSYYGRQGGPVPPQDVGQPRPPVPPQNRPPQGSSTGLKTQQGSGSKKD